MGLLEGLYERASVTYSPDFFTASAITETPD
jgi:hypothetical protein